MLVAAVAAVLAVVGSVLGVVLTGRGGPDLDANYLAELSAQGLSASYPSEEVAVAQGQAFCTQLLTGSVPLQGYQSQLVAVRHYCPAFTAGFDIIPTPAEQQADLLTRLRADHLGGLFPSDAAAVAHAQAVCSTLDDGGAQQGPAEDAVAVSVYCPTYSSGFRTLEPFKVKGKITLLDFSVYFPNIVSYGKWCEGSGGYSDIRPGTDVVIKNADGKQIARTRLGEGRGSAYRCTMPFEFAVMEGEEDYIIQIAERGAKFYTEAQLKVPGKLHLSLGP